MEGELERGYGVWAQDMEEKLERLRAREAMVAEEERAAAAAWRDLADQERQLLEKTASHAAAVATWQVGRVTCTAATFVSTALLGMNE